MVLSQAPSPAPLLPPTPAQWLEDARAARSVMAHLLCPSHSRHASMEVQVRFEPAGILGGDFCDPFPLSEDQLVCSMGDVAGKGIAAALIAATLQATLRALLGRAASLPDVLYALNLHLLRWTAPHHFATLFLLSHRRRSGVLRYVNCGHPPALLLRQNGVVEKLDATATILGVFPDWQCQVAEVAFEPEDALLLYTDGLCEATEGDAGEFGIASLEEALRQASRTQAADWLDAILHQQRRQRSAPAEDDVTLMLIRPEKREATT